MTIFIFTLYGAGIGALAGGLTGAIVHLRTPEGSRTKDGADTGVQLSITCESVSLPMPYHGDLWILNTVMLRSGVGLIKYMPPPKKPEGLWPEEDVNGFGYRCTVKNHGTQAAFGVSFPVIVSVLNLIRTGSTWTTGEVKETHTTTVSIPLPLGQQGHDQFSFYVCSHDPDGPLTVQLPSTAFINSDDPKKKREVSVRVTSIAGNPFTVPPKEPIALRHVTPTKVPPVHSDAENHELPNQQHCETGSLCNQDSQVNAPQTVTNYAPVDRHLTQDQSTALSGIIQSFPNGVQIQVYVVNLAEPFTYGSEISVLAHKYDKGEDLIESLEPLSKGIVVAIKDQNDSSYQPAQQLIKTMGANGIVVSGFVGNEHIAPGTIRILVGEQ